MKTSVATILFVAMSLFAPTAFAGTTGTVEVFFRPEGSLAHPSADIFLAHHFESSSFGVSAFALTTEGWAEFYAGPTWAPKDWIELGFAVGFEHAPESKVSPRFEASVWAGYESFSFLGIVEFDPKSFKGDDSGVWFDLTPKYTASDWLAIGAKYRRPVGTGPLIELSLPTTPSVTVWLSWMPIDPEKVDGSTTHLARFLVGLAGRF